MCYSITEEKKQKRILRSDFEIVLKNTKSDKKIEQKNEFCFLNFWRKKCNEFEKIRKI